MAEKHSAPVKLAFAFVRLIWSTPILKKQIVSAIDNLAKKC